MLAIVVVLNSEDNINSKDNINFVDNKLYDYDIYDEILYTIKQNNLLYDKFYISTSTNKPISCHENPNYYKSLSLSLPIPIPSNK